ncbi:hypothetical protein ACFL5V_12075, partial [Fibrobacterota bacterium]
YVTCQYPADKYFSGKKNDKGYEILFHKNINVSGNQKTQRLKFYRNKNEVRYLADLSFSDFAEGFSSVESIRMKKGNHIGFTIHFPYSKVKGIIAVNDDTMNVSGVGYLDHIYQSDLATDIYSRGIRYFSLSKDIEGGFVFVCNTKNVNTTTGISVRGSKNAVEGLIPKELGKSQEFIRFAHDTLEFSAFEERHKWGVLDEVPKGLGRVTGLFAKNMVLTRGIGKTKDKKKYMITKINIK